MTKNQLRRHLLKRDSNMRDFAIRHKFHPRTVVCVVDRYVGTKKTPRPDTVTYEILKTLSDELGKPVITGVL